MYYFLHNSRGDITGVYNSSGVLRARYNYDSWGNVTVTDASGNVITDENHIGNLNKIRYRGYYQDTETGLYYLMSRYYDPQTHRFVNADGYFSTGRGILDTNMNIYCMNNPINYFDPTGTSCATHSYWYMPTCTACNPFYREYKIREKIFNKPATVWNAGKTSDNRVVHITKNKNYTYTYANEIIVYDFRKSKDPYMEVKDSYLVEQVEIQLEVIEMLQDYNDKYPVDPEWNRSTISMVKEWDIHNACYDFNIAKDRTRDVSLNNNAQWFY